MLSAIRLIKAAFPGWSDEQTEILQDRFAEHEFSDQRMIDSIKHVIDTYEGYGRIPNIANFVQFDRHAKLYRHSQLDAIVQRGEAGYADFAIAVIPGLSGCRSAEAAGHKSPLYILRRDAASTKIKTIDCKPADGWSD
jgi:hypothetical protein